MRGVCLRKRCGKCYMKYTVKVYFKAFIEWARTLSTNFESWVSEICSFNAISISENTGMWFLLIYTSPDNGEHKRGAQAANSSSYSNNHSRCTALEIVVFIYYETLPCHQQKAQQGHSKSEKVQENEQKLKENLSCRPPKRPVRPQRLAGISTKYPCPSVKLARPLRQIFSTDRQLNFTNTCITCYVCTIYK